MNRIQQVIADISLPRNIIIIALVALGIGLLMGHLFDGFSLRHAEGKSCTGGEVTFYTNGVLCAPYRKAVTDLDRKRVFLIGFSPNLCRCFWLPPKATWFYVEK